MRMRACGSSSIPLPGTTTLTPDPGTPGAHPVTTSTYRLPGVKLAGMPAKIEMLGVRAETLAALGAVSEATAREMAAGALARSGADVAVAVTGVAGPAGGTPEKPVGLVWISISTRKMAHATKFQFPGDRAFVRQRAAQNALNLLRKELHHGR